MKISSLKKLSLCLGVYVSLLNLTPAAMAAELYVANAGTDDSNCQTLGTPCATIPYALTQANVAGGDTIHFAAETYVIDAEVTIDRPIIFAGMGMDLTTLVNGNASLDNLFIINITDGTPLVSFQSLAMTNADAGVDNLRFIYTQGTEALDGVKADLLLSEVRFTEGYFEFASAIYFDHSGVLEISGCEFSNNIVHDSSSGIMMTNSTSLLVSDTFFDGNTSIGMSSVLYLANVSTTAFIRSTIANSNNQTGPAVYLADTIAVFTNVTFYNNITDDGSTPNLTTDLFIGGGASTLDFNHVTLYNDVDTGNYSIEISGGATMAAHHSIFSYDDGHAICTTNITTNDYNFFYGDITDSCSLSGTDSSFPFPIFQTPSLADNGGYVPTMKVLALDFAFDAGGEFCDSQEDARAVDRDPPIGAGCEIGAYESTCGNNIVEAEYGEDCDDGANVDADGCSRDCETETQWYADADGDTYGDSTDAIFAVTQPVGRVADDTDCNDANADISPAVDDICDGLDNDCSGLTDDPYLADLGDACTNGLGVCAAEGQIDCADDGGTECNAVALDAGDELCGDELDNDCDGDVDEGFETEGEACSSAGVGVCSVSGLLQCSEDLLTLECDAEEGVAADEICDDDLDNDCDGDTDVDDADCVVSGDDDDDDDTTGDDDTTSSSGGCSLQSSMSQQPNLQIYFILLGSFLMLRYQVAKTKI